MDLYITDSLQDMLDMDIKNEMATDLSSMTDYVSKNKHALVIFTPRDKGFICQVPLIYLLSLDNFEKVRR